MISLRRPGHRLGFILILGGILFVSFVSLSYLNFVTIRRSLRQEIISSSLPLTRETIYSDIVKDLMPPINVSASMARDSFLINWTLSGESDTERIIEYLSKIRNEFGFFSAFFVSAGTLAYYHSDGLLKHISPTDNHDVWFYKFADSGLEYDLDVDKNQAADDQLTIFVNYRMNDYDGRFLGVTGVGIEMASFAGFLADRGAEYGRMIYLVSSDGTIQAHADPDLVEATSMHDRPALSTIIDMLLEQTSTPIDASFTEHGHQILITSRFMSEIDWHIIVEQDEATMLVAPRINLIRTLLIGVATSICILAISMVTVDYYQKRLEKFATTDELTSLANRREFEAAFDRFTYRFDRYATSFSIVMIDIDRFKEINDLFGHLVGDQALVTVTNAMTSTLRSVDLLARWGGDEFILLTECALEQAAELAERIRSRITVAVGDERSEITTPVTASCGVTEFVVGDTIETAVSRADNALYDSKARGRNTVSIRRSENERS